ncbi:MAG: cold shock and DUF1294 domain-containing protein, partial [Gammaproteobacteria bacterium]|nr:cold shock and DUF1294 domain-containing protein [Gammaproteobacteria bacterium]
MRSSGKLTTWNDEKGFGFITPDAGGKQVFVHVAAFAQRSRRPEAGIGLSYELARDEKGRERAENARLAGVGFRLGAAFRAFIFSAGFLALVAGVAMSGYLPLWILWLYLILSVLTFVVYYLDKRAAQKGARRTPEYQLHLWALPGGWPGALFAQQLLRHKSSKFGFRVVFWLTLLV